MDWPKSCPGSSLTRTSDDLSPPVAIKKENGTLDGRVCAICRSGYPPLVLPGSPLPSNSTLVRPIQVDTVESIPVEGRLVLAIACFVNAYAPCIGFVRNRPAGQLISLLLQLLAM